MDTLYWMMAQCPQPKGDANEIEKGLSDTMDDDINYKILIKTVNELNITFNKKRVLEIGCGRGYFMDYIRWARGRPVGIEPYSPSAKMAQKRHICINGGYETCRMRNLDLTMSYHVIEHTDNPVDFIQKQHGILKHGGEMILIFPNYGGFINKGKWRCKISQHKWLTDIKTVTKIAIDAGFIIKKSYTYGGCTIKNRTIKEAVNWFYKTFNCGDVGVIHGVKRMITYKTKNKGEKS